jgi:hypothetical protein
VGFVVGAGVLLSVLGLLVGGGKSSSCASSTLPVNAKAASSKIRFFTGKLFMVKNEKQDKLFYTTY